jgi:hypothetical protein
MGTRSVVGIENDDGTVTYIYVHFDGYIEHIGTVLVNHYSTLERVQKLMKLGNCSSIDLNGVPKPYGEPAKTASSAYDFVNDNYYKHIEYFYLFVSGENRLWHVSSQNLHEFTASKREDESKDLDIILDENITKMTENMKEEIRQQLTDMIYEEISDETIISNITEKIIQDYTLNNHLEKLLNPKIDQLKPYLYDEIIGIPQLRNKKDNL